MQKRSLHSLFYFHQSIKITWTLACFFSFKYAPIAALRWTYSTPTFFSNSWEDHSKAYLYQQSFFPFSHFAFLAFLYLDVSWPPLPIRVLSSPGFSWPGSLSLLGPPSWAGLKGGYKLHFLATNICWGATGSSYSQVQLVKPPENKKGRWVIVIYLTAVPAHIQLPS